MAALAATSSATPSLPNTLIRSRLEAARREVDQAQAYADQLGTQVEQQQRVVEQSQQRVRTLEKRSSTPSGSSPVAPSSSVAASSQEDPTYIEALTGAFQAAKAIWTSDLSTVQRNLVTSTLLEASKAVWSSGSPNAQAIQRYDKQTAITPAQTMGRVLNASA